MVRDIVEDRTNEILVSDASFAELCTVAWRKKHDAGLLVKIVRAHATVFEIYTNIWVEAAEKREQRRKKHKDFGMIDAVLLAIQRHTGATIVTGDKHFEGLPNVVML